MTYRERIESEYAKQNEQFAANDNINEQGFDSDFFGIDNIKSYPACLDLRFSDCSRKAIPYACIQEINYAPEEGIEITTATRTVKINGRELEKLFDYLTAYRVRYVQENVGSDVQENGLFVREILIETA